MARPPVEQVDLAIVGAGAAGLAAAIFAGEAAQGRGLRIVLLDGARKPGAKILVSGGGRCNVTNERVEAGDFNGGPQPIIRKVLRAFGVRQTLDWMESLGVPLKLEPTGKYFPTSDSAGTVLNALLGRTRELGVELRAACRVTGLTPREGAFHVELAGVGDLLARRVILATGGLALPKSGSDGAGLAWLARLGHGIVPTTPALVPLKLRPGKNLGGRFAEFSGVSFPARLTLADGQGRAVQQVVGPLLFTHFGVSGPAALDISRHWLRHRLDQPGEPAQLLLGHPSLANVDAAEAWLIEQRGRHPRQAVANVLASLYPERFAAAMSRGLASMSQLTREERRALAHRLAALPLAVDGDRGYAFAEVTAGGVDLREIDARDMQSRRQPGLYLCGELLDVDGRIGGFNFQWAWAGGYLAGRGAVAGLVQTP